MTYPPPPSRPSRKLFEPDAVQKRDGVVFVDHHGGEWGDLTENQRLAGTAQKCAREWHKDQVDKQGRDYFMHHLWPVANMARALAIGAGLDADTVDLVEAYAWLHDVGEDVFESADATEAALIGAGLGDLVEGVEMLTRRGSSPYQPYVANIAVNGSIEVVIVKLADNLVNSTTLDDLPFDDQARMGRKWDRARPPLLQRVAAHIVGGGFVHLGYLSAD